MSILRATPILICASLAAGAAVAAGAAEFPTPLPPDSTGKIATLPAKYPTSWVFLN